MAFISSESELGPLNAGIQGNREVILFYGTVFQSIIDEFVRFNMRTPEVFFRETITKFLQEYQELITKILPEEKAEKVSRFRTLAEKTEDEQFIEFVKKIDFLSPNCGSTVDELFQFEPFFRNRFGLANSFLDILSTENKISVLVPGKIAYLRQIDEREEYAVLAQELASIARNVYFLAGSITTQEVISRNKGENEYPLFGWGEKGYALYEKIRLCIALLVPGFEETLLRGVEKYVPMERQEEAKKLADFEEDEEETTVYGNVFLLQNSNEDEESQQDGAPKNIYVPTTQGNPN